MWEWRGRERERGLTVVFMLLECKKCGFICHLCVTSVWLCLLLECNKCAALLDTWLSRSITSAGNTKEWVSIEPRYALITFKAHGIIEAVEALPSSGVAHWPQCRVHIATTNTCGAPTDLLWKCIAGYQEAVFNMVE